MSPNFRVSYNINSSVVQVRSLRIGGRGGGGDSRGPRGAQYSPDLLISSLSVHFTRLFAASSGVTAASPIILAIMLTDDCKSCEQDIV